MQPLSIHESIHRRQQPLEEPFFWTLGQSVLLGSFLNCPQTNLRSIHWFKHDGGGPVWFNWSVSSALFHPTSKGKGERTKCQVSHHKCWQVYKQPVMLRATGGPWVGLCRSLMMESMNVDIALCFHANWRETQAWEIFDSGLQGLAKNHWKL